MVWFLIGIGVVALFLYFITRGCYKKYAGRPLSDMEWEEAFFRHKGKIRKYREIIDHSFCVPKKALCKVKPSDSIMKLYRASVGEWPVDNSEIENFCMMVEKEYGIKFSEEDTKEIETLTFGSFLTLKVIPKITSS
ncbi:MAG: hypothetical protein KAT56_11660 [Sedimentisphaerales bacterium]|nr:hypothetical protein [Sedimentisphaerales bacterium]